MLQTNERESVGLEQNQNDNDVHEPYLNDEHVSDVEVSHEQSSTYDSEEESDDDMQYYERAIQEIAKGDSYICMICTVEMDYTCQMFACKKCYRVFDYACIREWALKSTEKTVDKIWKCPNCYHIGKKVPTRNRPTCWCGKVVNPDHNPLDPNSCGQTCNAPTCVHGCSKICHLGPHPECTRMVEIKCHCGKHSKSIFCYQSKAMKKHFDCQENCGLPLSCGIHKCKKKCHSGLCGPCPELIRSEDSANDWIKCYCGIHSKDSIKCSETKFPKSGRSSKDEGGNEWVGVFACEDIRTVDYACHKHSFIEPCISPPTVNGKKTCPFLPSILKTCPCGRTALEELTKPRKHCTDPIPTCSSRCCKPLKCGKHSCPFTCHDGACMDPCLQIDSVKCACEQSTFLVPCGFQEKPHCNIKCESLMSCRRHRCIDRCCSGRPSALERKKRIFRSQDLMDESLVEAQHICLKPCNLTLSCGSHQCQRKCHPGKCPPCLESDSNDLVCPCGKTVIPAPVRCGTKLPLCNHACIKVVRGESECGHKPMPHTCHPLDLACPPCTETVFKPCKCGKKDKVRTVCFQTDVSCGTTCGKPLSGCHHTCQKTCHLPENCQKVCKQICRQKRQNCDHTCPKPCHGKSECPDLPCAALVKITCRCGRIEKKVACGAKSDAASVTEGSQLDCNEECEALKRLKELREAFGISEVSNESTNNELDTLKKLVSVATTFEELQLPFTETVLSVYAKQERWCLQIENIVNKLMSDKTRSSLHFKPMRPPQRHFIRELAKAYNLYSESQDREPMRSVFIKKEDNNKSSRPILSLAEAFPLFESFKELQKERKIQEFQARTTAKLINFEVQNAEPEVEVAKNNGFLVHSLVKGNGVDNLKRFFEPHLKHTLVAKPQYLIIDDGKTALVYPENYEAVSVNTERDMELLVGHFDFMAKEVFLADSISLCSIDEELGRRLDSPVAQEDSPVKEEN
ncbi:Fap1p [Saccharomyces eubayanus]|uniref:Fap1p n=1 Tax=Saccharomyces eubayanus TaxID=1080349 RepID=UPI0006C1A7EC|nr:FAP1-like protein [Saccharomyces eubayanus]KOG97135.1 FAP1-like protein [Saccharomyces eubayanus]